MVKAETVAHRHGGDRKASANSGQLSLAIHCPQCLQRLAQSHQQPIHFRRSPALLGLNGVGQPVLFDGPAKARCLANLYFVRARALCARVRLMGLS
jgi:hypothetical protein